MVNRDKAWDKLLAMNDFGIGNSKTNCLLWTATQAAPLSNFDETVVKIDPATIIDPQCSANSACNAIGNKRILLL